jgi:hypothetical protein
MVFCFVQNFFFGQHKELEYLFFLSRKARNFFQNLTLDYMTKTDYFFFLHQNQIFFFSNIGNSKLKQKYNFVWRSEIYDDRNNKQGDNKLRTYRLFKDNISSEKYLLILITKLPNSEQSYKGKVKTHKYINRQNQSTTGKL